MKILIVDDHPLVRKGIASTLSFEDDIEEIREASNYKEAIKQLSGFYPDITVMDVSVQYLMGCKILGMTFVIPLIVFAYLLN